MREPAWLRSPVTLQGWLTSKKDLEKDFYKLCTCAQRQHHWYKFNLHVYLTHLDVGDRLPLPMG